VLDYALHLSILYVSNVCEAQTIMSNIYHFMCSMVYVLYHAMCVYVFFCVCVMADALSFPFF